MLAIIWDLAFGVWDFPAGARFDLLAFGILPRLRLGFAAPSLSRLDQNLPWLF
jgi:hypothetical protein